MADAYGLRGGATTDFQQRRDWRGAIQQEVKDARPAFGLYAPHYLAIPRSFLQADSARAAEVGVPLAGVGGLDRVVAITSARQLAAALLMPGDMPTLDLWES